MFQNKPSSEIDYHLLTLRLGCFMNTASSFQKRTRRAELKRDDLVFLHRGRWTDPPSFIELTLAADLTKWF